MKLVDLEPRWVLMHNVTDDGFKIGLTFLCPHCRSSRIAVLFENPIDPNDWFHRSVWGDFWSGKWHRDGDTFDTISLTPSIDQSKHGHWHGFVKNGDVI